MARAGRRQERRGVDALSSATRRDEACCNRHAPFGLRRARAHLGARRSSAMKEHRLRRVSADLGPWRSQPVPLRVLPRAARPRILLFSARDVLRKTTTFELFAACDSCERGVRCAKGAKLPGDILDHFFETSIKPSGFDDPETAHLYDLFSGLQQHIETPLISEQRKDRFNVLFVNAPRIIRATLRRQVSKGGNTL